jgi:hypothetical protein
MFSYVFTWAKAHPVVAWYLAGFETLMTTAFPLSLFHPSWAQELSAKAVVLFDVAKDLAHEFIVQGGSP